MNDNRGAYWFVMFIFTFIMLIAALLTVINDRKEYQEAIIKHHAGKWVIDDNGNSALLFNDEIKK